MNIGIMGGSFDPVHYGHLRNAESVREELGLNRLIFVPAAQAPLKPNALQASAVDRVAMLKLALGEVADAEVEEFEIRRGGVSYSIDTARHFRRVYPQASLFWIIGADQVARLPEWREIAELAKLVEFAWVARPGSEENAPVPIADLRLRRCRGQRVEMSSSDIRRRVKEGGGWSDCCPQKVVAYIREKRLYV